MKKFDIHCHVFNKDLITRRIVISLLHEMIEMLKLSHRSNRSKKENKEDSEVFIEKLIKIANFLHIGFRSDSMKVFNIYQRSYADEDFIFCPLMFDLIWCFRESYSESSDDTITRSFEKQNEFNELIDRFDELKSHVADNEGLFSDTRKQNIRDKGMEKIAGFIAKLLKEKENQLFAHHVLLNDISDFKDQIGQILAIKEAYPEKVFPFFVVDPRRPDIFEMVKIYVGKDKPFYGVKIYTPNGYSPTDPLLFGNNNGDDCIYKYCIENDIPITAHNSAGGFSNYVKRTEIKGHIYEPDTGQVKKSDGWVYFTKNMLKDGKDAIRERALVLNYPDIWKLVLERYPNLRLNLAHFGSGNDQWSQRIYDLIALTEGGTYKFPNLYTDLSCFSKKDILKFKTKWFNTASLEIKKKFLYGSDYYLNLFSEISMKAYYKNFTKLFAPDELSLITSQNPFRFLNFK